MLPALLSAIHPIHPIYKRYIAIQRYSDKKRYIVSDVSPPLRIERVCEANEGVVGYTADDARESLRGRLEEGVRYKVVIHVGDVKADGVGGTIPPSPSPLHTHTHMAGADKKRTVRRPTTSRWSAGSLAEMQRHMAGRGGGDGVT